MTRFDLLARILGFVPLTPAALAQGPPAQELSYQTGDPADWPPELDVVIAAPDNHKILLETDHARVLSEITP